ncbi:unnamed protein product [Paramecium octaurelia]|uniref:Transmembrane protein n=1 Tax=Paramecium octaurelia TaxID=43137 RepID=A0A8S1W3Z1_PAROT|nr:unnamed protein product [Paramecium octaurelia]CAD8183965.1 unnamed protein product [Paramecium octaurelia]
MKNQVGYSEEELYNNRYDFNIKLKEPTYITQTILQKLTEINSLKNSLNRKKKSPTKLNIQIEEGKLNIILNNNTLISQCLQMLIFLNLYLFITFLTLLPFYPKHQSNWSCTLLFLFLYKQEYKEILILRIKIANFNQF